MLSKLGKYEIQRKIGSGAMGVVYLAEDPRLGRPVALKTTTAEVASNPELLKRFYREAQAAAKLCHPNIVTIYDIDEASGIPFIAMEFLEGDNLQKVISERKDLLVLKKLQIIIDLCKGLDYAHQRGIVHRDIKPGNIMLADNGQVKIVDFGIARVGVSTMTRTGAVLGTVRYMSPEQVQAQTVDARSDIFSVGVVLYELLTYQTPFPGDDVSSILFKILNEEPEPITNYLHECPPQLEHAVQVALAKDREKRYQTAGDLAFDLQRVADGLRRSTVGAYLDQGQRSLEAGELTLAKDSLQKILEIDSNHELAQSLLADIRERIQSRQRVQTIERNLAGVKEALGSEQYEEAHALLEEVLRLDPGNKEAQRYKQLVSQQRERAGKVRSHLERAEKLAANTEFPKAKAELETLLSVDPGNAAAVAMMDWIVKEIADQERQRLARQYLDSARLQLTEKNFGRALELLDQARESNTFTVEIDTLSRLVRSGQEKEQRRQLLVKHLANIEEYLKRGQFDEGFAQVEEALREFPDDPQVLRLHTQALRRAEVHKKNRYVEEQLQAARELLEKNQYPAALTVLEKAIGSAPNDPRLTSLLKTVQEAHEQRALEASKKEAIREANEQLRAQNFAGAIETLKKILGRVGQSSELSDLLQFARERSHEQQRQESIQRVISRAQSYLREEQYEEAVQTLTRAQEELKAGEIAALLSSAQERRTAFLRRREEIVATALQLLQSGEPAKAVALFEAAPKIYFKNESFQRTYSQCRQNLDRATFVRTAVEEVKKCLAEDDTGAAKSVLDQALKPYPDDSTLLALQDRVRQEDLRLRREQRLKLLEEAQVALGRMEFGRATELLTSAEWESSDLPELAARAKSMLEQVQRQENIQRVVSRAQGHLREEQYEEAVQVLTRAQEELKAGEISALLASAQERREAFLRRREEMVASALQMLQSGEAAKAVALFEAAPKIYFKNESFQRTYSQCRQSLDRANFVRSAAEQIKKCLADEDIGAAESVLEQSLKHYPDEPSLLALQSRVKEEDLRLRREQRVKLLEEAQAALGHMEFARAAELLSSVDWESFESPELAARAKALLEEVRRRESEPGMPRLAMPVPGKRLGRSPVRISPGLPPKTTKTSRTAVWVTAVAALLVLAAVGAWNMKTRNATGYLQLTAAPWGQVTGVTSANGKHLDISGETPLQVELPAGLYNVELKEGQLTGKVEVRVVRGQVSVYNYTFPEVKVHDLVQTLVSEY
jgi:eukaryotic-like serine/threonine-protein kinase